LPRHRSEQYFTESQSRRHLRRQVNGSPQIGQTFDGSFSLVCMAWSSCGGDFRFY
jgi:hypothetical protein